MPNVTRKTGKATVRQRAAKAPAFPPGSLEAKLAAFGRRVPIRQWNRLPAASLSQIDLVVYRKTARG
jgi:hypothetical protein